MIVRIFRARLDPIVIAVSLGESHWKILVVICSRIRWTRIVHSHSKAQISTPEAQNHNCYWMVQICFLQGRIKSDRLPTAGPRSNNKRHRSERSPFIWESCKKWRVFNYKRRIPTRTHAWLIWMKLLGGMHLRLCFDSCNLTCFCFVASQWQSFNISINSHAIEKCTHYLICVQKEKISQIGNNISLKQLWLSVWSMVGSDGEEANV